VSSHPCRVIAGVSQWDDARAQQERLTALLLRQQQQQHHNHHQQFWKMSPVMPAVPFVH
jgi:hypothetical protein